MIDILNSFSDFHMCLTSHVDNCYKICAYCTISAENWSQYQEISNLPLGKTLTLSYEKYVNYIKCLWFSDTTLVQVIITTAWKEN